MGAREEFISALKDSHRVMQENEEAYSRYIEARDLANIEFCSFSNRFGWQQALNAKKEALGDK